MHSYPLIHLCGLGAPVGGSSYFIPSNTRKSAKYLRTKPREIGDEVGVSKANKKW